MQRLEVSCAVRRIYASLGAKVLTVLTWKSRNHVWTKHDGLKKNIILKITVADCINDIGNYMKKQLKTGSKIYQYQNNTNIRSIKH